MCVRACVCVCVCRGGGSFENSLGAHNPQQNNLTKHIIDGVCVCVCVYFHLNALGVFPCVCVCVCVLFV